MSEIIANKKIEQGEIIKPSQPFQELAEVQLAFVGGGSGIALCE
jgi:hypothetical protein